MSLTKKRPAFAWEQMLASVFFAILAPLGQKVLPPLDLNFAEKIKILISNQKIHKVQNYSILSACQIEYSILSPRIA